MKTSRECANHCVHVSLSPPAEVGTSDPSGESGDRTYAQHVVWDAVGGVFLQDLSDLLLCKSVLPFPHKRRLKGPLSAVSIDKALFGFQKQTKQR